MATLKKHICRLATLALFAALASVNIPYPSAHAATIGTPIDFLALNRGLVGWWAFEAADIGPRIRDRSGNNRDLYLLLSGSATTTIAGKIGQGISLDGVNDEMIVSDNTAFDFGDFTYSLWIKPRSHNGWRTIIDVNDDYQSLLLSGGAYLQFELYNRCSATVGNAKLNVWQHIVWTVSGSNYAFYQDGKLVASGSGCSGPINGDNLNIGAWQSGEQNFDGSYDDVRVYNRALSAVEVAQVYSLGTSRTSVSSILLPQGLVGWWTFDGGDMIPNVRDKSGNGQNGNLFGGATSTVAGKIGRALNFDGTDDRVDIASDLVGLGDVTTCAWAKLRTTPADNTQESFFDTVYYQAGYFYIAGLYYILVTSNANNSLLYELPSNPVGKWNHICILRPASGDASVYFNGVGVKTDNDGNPITGFNLSLGGHATGGRNFNGAMDDARVYNRLLSSAEIRQLYEAGGTKIATSPTNTNALTRGLAGWWTMDGNDTVWSSPTAATTRDLSGNGNTGTITNMNQSTAPAAGKTGQGMRFVGVNDLINIGNNSSINNLTTKTISAWIYPRSMGTSGGNFGSIFNADTGGDAYYYWLLCSNDGAECESDVNTMIFFSKTTGTYGGWHAPANTITLNQWQMVTISFDCSSIANTPKFYKNGTLVSTITSFSPSGTSVCDDSSTNKTIGNALMGASGFDGVIDDLRLYNRILTDADVKQLYNQGK